jgi:cation diffusion facilitator family transporter
MTDKPLVSGDDRAAARAGMRASRLGIAVNAALSLVKGAAAILGNSQALLADAVESATDVLSSLVVWAAIRFSVRPPDIDHPYGHGKAEPLGAAVVSATLLVAAYGIARESISRLGVRHSRPEAYTLVVLVLVVAVKAVLSHRVAKVGDEVGSVAVQSDAGHHLSDAITSAAAFFGILLAILGGPGWENADDWAALFASLVISINAVRLVRPAVNELMDRAPDPSIEFEVREVASKVTGVCGLHRCRVRKMGLEYYVDLDVLVNPQIPVVEGHAIAHRVQDAVITANRRIAKVFVHVEPFFG